MVLLLSVFGKRRIQSTLSTSRGLITLLTLWKINLNEAFTVKVRMRELTIQRNDPIILNSQSYIDEGYDPGMHVDYERSFIAGHSGGGHVPVTQLQVFSTNTTDIFIHSTNISDYNLLTYFDHFRLIA